MTTTGLSAKEREEVFDEFLDLRDLLQVEAWKMSERKDFQKVVAVAKSGLKKFREEHSEIATHALAERVCEYAVFDVRWDAEWQRSAADYEIEMSSPTYELSGDDWKRLSKETRCDFQFELAELDQGTTLQMLAYGTGDSPVVCEAVIW